MNNEVAILMADDDADDRLMVKDAFADNHIINPIVFVEDGEQLIEYLFRTGRFEGSTHSLPGMILLDLNMPKIDGREALNKIKSSHLHRHIPVIVFTTSKAQEDTIRMYKSGVNSFIVKPVTYHGLVEVIGVLGKYWLDVVSLPEEPH